MVDQGRVPYHEHDDSDIREALASALRDRTEYDRKTQRQNRRAQGAAYLLIVAVAAGGFYIIGQQQDDLCKGAAENRKAIRGSVSATAELGRSLVLQGLEPEGYVNPQQAQALARIDSFEAGQLDALELPICEP